jgi:hypothetical protein
VGKNCPMVLLYVWQCIWCTRTRPWTKCIWVVHLNSNGLHTICKETLFVPTLFFHKTPRTPNFSQAHQKSRRTLSEEQSCWEGPLPSGRSVVAKSHHRPHREEPSPTETLAMEPPLPLFCPSGGGLIALLMTMDSRRVVPPVEAEARA